MLPNPFILRGPCAKTLSRHLYIPVETAARELDAKLLTSLFATDRGFRVVLGNRQLLDRRIHLFPAGIYLAHNVDRRRARMLRLLEAMGHRLVAWDEEGLVWLSPEKYLERRTSRESLSRISRFYAWGEEQANILIAAGVRMPVLPVGNPRVDLLRPAMRRLYEDAAGRLQERYGDFILINSNFGWINYHLAPMNEKDADRHLQMISDRSGHPLSYLKKRWKVYRKFRELVRFLSREFPQRTIVVRPHPSESPLSWQELGRQLNNVRVHYDRELIPWLMAAGAIVHNGCTTAVETALLGRAAISYEPLGEDDGSPDLPRRTSIRAADLQEVQQLLNRNAPLPPSAHDALNRAISGWREKRTSAERIVDDLARLPPPAPASLARLAGRARAFLRGVEKRIASMRPTSPANPDYIGKKFPLVEVAQLQERLQEMAALTGCRAPVVRQLSDRIFELEQ